MKRTAALMLLCAACSRSAPPAPAAAPSVAVVPGAVPSAPASPVAAPAAVAPTAPAPTAAASPTAAAGPTAAASQTAAAAAVPGPSTPAPAAGPAPAPAGTSASAPAPMPAAHPGELPVTSAAATAAAREQALARSGVTFVDPTAQFHVEVPVALAEARLSLLDGEGAMVPATGGAEIGAGKTRFHLAPDAPLVTGSPYTLKLDGAVERDPRDPDGRSYAPASWALLTTGEKPKAPPKKQKDHRRRKR